MADRGAPLDGKAIAPSKKATSAASLACQGTLRKIPCRQGNRRDAVPGHDEHSPNSRQGHDGREPHGGEGEALGKYDYRIAKLDSTACTIAFKQRVGVGALGTGWEDLGEFTYGIEDAKRAGLLDKKNKDGSPNNWTKYPQNMLFARAISSGTRLYCPDVFNGNLVYVPEELGAQVDEDGEPVAKAA